MKIDVAKIPPEGLKVTEEINASRQDLETEIVKFKGPVRVEAQISRITNTVTAELCLSALMFMNCSRCLGEFGVSLHKQLRLSYPLEKSELTLDLTPDIREEIILDYPLKPLCRPDCLGLCLKCGKNLNEGGCSCGTT